MINANEFVDALRMMNAHAEMLGGGGGENPRHARNELIAFSKHLAQKYKLDDNEILRFHNKPFRRGLWQMYETGWDVTKFFAGGFAAKFLHALAADTIRGLNRGGLPVWKLPASLLFFGPVAALRRYGKTVDRNKMTLDMARVLQKVWADNKAGGAREQLIAAVRGGNTKALDDLEKLHDFGPTRKVMRKWVPRAVAFSAGVGLGSLPYQELVAFFTAWYTNPAGIPGSLAMLPWEGVKSMGQVAMEIPGNVSEAAVSIWNYFSKLLR